MHLSIICLIVRLLLNTQFLNYRINIKLYKYLLITKFNYSYFQIIFNCMWLLQKIHLFYKCLPFQVLFKLLMLTLAFVSLMISYLLILILLIGLNHLGFHDRFGISSQVEYLDAVREFILRPKYLDLNEVRRYRYFCPYFQKQF